MVVPTVEMLAPPKFRNLPKRKTADDIAWGSSSNDARFLSNLRRLLKRLLILLMPVTLTAVLGCGVYDPSREDAENAVKNAFDTNKKAAEALSKFQCWKAYDNLFDNADLFPGNPLDYWQGNIQKIRVTSMKEIDDREWATYVQFEISCTHSPDFQRFTTAGDEIYIERIRRDKGWWALTLKRYDDKWSARIREGGYYDPPARFPDHGGGEPVCKEFRYDPNTLQPYEAYVPCVSLPKEPLLERKAPPLERRPDQ